MKSWMEIFVSSLALFGFVSLSSCGYMPENAFEKLQAVDEEIIEVAGICEVQENSEPCPIKTIPKYFRQLIALDKKLSYGERPNTINNFTILQHIKNGYFFENIIGYKYIKGSGMAGSAPLAAKPSDINPAATVYEVFTHKFDAKTKQALDLGEPNEVIILRSTCYFQKYYRGNEQVVVIIQEEDVDELNGFNCSAKGHLYYFGIDPQKDEVHSFYEIVNGFNKEVKFDMPRISEHLKKLE